MEFARRISKYEKLSAKSADLDAFKLSAERQSIRTAMMQDAVERIRTAYGQHSSYDHIRHAQRDAAATVSEEPEKQRFVREPLNGTPDHRLTSQKSMSRRDNTFLHWYL